MGNNIRTFRTLRGISQEGLAAQLKKSQNWVQKIEAGEIDITISNLEAIATVLNVEPNMLMTFNPAQIFNNCSNFQGNYINYNIQAELSTISDILQEIKKKL
ncbi:MAG: helix-turn-helix transcriptional regulator [Bacteroidia bacterium]|nr:helix-turn-helix transcriptional regulator [Bacteroidia bacterium]